jgi:cytochrome b6
MRPAGQSAGASCGGSSEDVWKSIFRVKHDETPRNRALGVLSNVFLHLHPAKINRDAVAYNFTWGMGGITFYLFVVLTLDRRAV